MAQKSFLGTRLFGSYPLLEQSDCSLLQRHFAAGYFWDFLEGSSRIRNKVPRTSPQCLLHASARLWQCIVDFKPDIAYYPTNPEASHVLVVAMLLTRRAFP